MSNEHNESISNDNYHNDWINLFELLQEISQAFQGYHMLDICSICVTLGQVRYVTGGRDARFVDNVSIFFP